jgi:hypothetical protein
MGNANNALEIEATRISGSGNLHIDFVLIPNSLEWIGLLNLVNNYQLGDVYDLVLDAVNHSVFGTALIGPSYSVSDIGEKRGSSYLNLILEKGFDHRIRFLFVRASRLYSFNTTFGITISGLHATVYPFAVGL